MPNEVAKVHAEHEDDCAQCHARFDQQTISQKCLICHQKVDADRTAKQGFHGRFPGATNGQCEVCHTEHIGRDGDIVRFDAALFDHEFSDFPLRGGHAQAACRQCHKPDAAFRDAPHACNDCHQSGDVHAGKLGADCKQCHDVQLWSKTRFDHAQTRFALTDAHAELTCSRCHAAPTFVDTPRTCVACHSPDDVHRGARGEDCAECHNVRNWQVGDFDHLKQTAFALRGQHAAAACNSCHVSGDLEAPLPTTCRECHREHDPHVDRFGEKCTSCHGEDTWRVEFGHGMRTDFPLLGAHKTSGCYLCHSAAAEHGQSIAPVGKTCIDCHGADDVHIGTLGSDCKTCHQESAWDVIHGFDHDFTKFPLLGSHAVVPCEQCHVDRRFQFAAFQCADCHGGTLDPHRGTLGQECDDCHDTSAWSNWQFDHDTRTRFPLTGSHKSAACIDCHGTVNEKLPMECIACHRRDDVHRGAFGFNCDSCHSTQTFRNALQRAR